MARYEAVVRSDVLFYNGLISPGLGADPERVEVAFEGYDIVWHPNIEDTRDGELDWPTLTVMTDDGNDYKGVTLAINRFLSALVLRSRPAYEPDHRWRDRVCWQVPARSVSRRRPEKRRALGCCPS